MLFLNESHSRAEDGFIKAVKKIFFISKFSHLCWMPSPYDQNVSDSDVKTCIINTAYSILHNLPYSTKCD